MWEDMDITVAERINPPAMVTANTVGPAVHFEPYRMVFNRDVTVTVPYDGASAGGQALSVYIYNHITEGWDSITPESVDKANKLVTFTTQVLGLFQVGAELCPTEQIYGADSEEVTLLRAFRDKVLDKTPAGQQMIRLYYQWSSAIVTSMEGDEAFKVKMKEIIDEALPLIRSLVH